MEKEYSLVDEIIDESASVVQSLDSPCRDTVPFAGLESALQALDSLNALSRSARRIQMASKLAVGYPDRYERVARMISYWAVKERF